MSYELGLGDWGLEYEPHPLEIHSKKTHPAKFIISGEFTHSLPFLPNNSLIIHNS